MLTTAHFQVIQEARARTLVERDVGREADATLGGTAGNRVLHAVAGEDLEAAVVETRREYAR